MCIRDRANAWDFWFSKELPLDLVGDEDLWKFEGREATRNSSGMVLGKLATRIPSLFGGSADLAPSNKSYTKGRGDFSAEDRLGCNMHFGVREHAMSAISNGIALHGGLRPYCCLLYTSRCV